MKIILLSIVLVFMYVPHVAAQYGSGAVTLPWESQRASVSQRIGLTDVTITYHRPAVNGRKIWDGLVPFNEGKPMPWRGGANENTTISFSTDVTIEGKKLEAGTYGLHFIPAKDEWVVIFSNNSTSWGSYSYSESEDALRVKVKPLSADFEEHLRYSFVSINPDKVLAELHWEKLKVRFEIRIDLHVTVLANIRKELRNTVGFSWVGYNSAAMYCADKNINLEEGLKWANRSISAEERFENLETKSQLLRLLGRTSEADSIFKTALAKATPLQINAHGRQLLGDKKIKEAMEIFQYNFKTNPQHWVVYAGLARGYEAEGEMKKAIESMKIALERAPEASKNGIRTIIQQWEKK